MKRWLGSPSARFRWLVLALAASLAACADRPPIIDESMATQLSANTTINDVKQILGAPTRFYAYKDGQKVLTYLRRCQDDPPDEKCLSAPDGFRWQRCLINFDATDLWSGTSCTWTNKP